MFKMVFILLVLPAISNAQLNTTDTLDWQFKLSFDGSLLDGNVARFLLTNRLELAYAQPAWGISTNSNYQYGTTRHIKTENDFVSYNFLYVTPLRKWYPYLMTVIETNYRRKIQFRFQVGPGVSYTVVSKKNNLTRLSLTGTYERTRFTESKFEVITDTMSNIIGLLRQTIRLYGRHRLFDNKIKLIYEFWWQQSMANHRNYRFHTEETVELVLSKIFSFRTGIRYSNENVRLKELKPYDIFWTFGFTFHNF